MVANRSAMPASRLMISRKFSRLRRQRSCLVLCTVASKRSTCRPGLAQHCADAIHAQIGRAQGLGSHRAAWVIGGAAGLVAGGGRVLCRRKLPASTRAGMAGGGEPGGGGGRPAGRGEWRGGQGGRGAPRRRPASAG